MNLPSAQKFNSTEQAPPVFNLKAITTHYNKRKANRKSMCFVRFSNFVLFYENFISRNRFHCPLEFAVKTFHDYILHKDYSVS